MIDNLMQYGYLILLILIIVTGVYFRKTLLKYIQNIMNRFNRGPKFNEVFNNRSGLIKSEPNPNLVSKNKKIPSVFATKSLTKKEKNQDACLSQYVESSEATVIAIADGLGSHTYAEVGSHFVVKSVMELVVSELEKNNTDLNYDNIFLTVQKELDDYIAKEYSEDKTIEEGRSFGTTLILGIDFPDKFVIAYIGNGSAFNISGYFSDFPESFYLPWNSINVLNPHTVEQNGKEAIYRLFSWKGSENECKPSIIELKKDNVSPGEIFVLTTDGVYSSDHVIPGKDEDGNIWIPSTPNMEILYEHLKRYMIDTDNITNDNLEIMLEDYLHDVKNKDEMHDDTTLGIVITGSCIEHYASKRNNIDKKAI